MVFHSVHNVLTVLIPPVLRTSVGRKLPCGWHDMRHVQPTTNSSAKEIHREGHCAGLMNTRAPWQEAVNIDSAKGVRLVGGCALGDSVVATQPM